jgi:hypothetical protein
MTRNRILNATIILVALQVTCQATFTAEPHDQETKPPTHAQPAPVQTPEAKTSSGKAAEDPKSTKAKPVPETKPARKLTKVEGTLTEARCYFTTGSVGGKHEYCAFMSLKANMPVGILTSQGEFVYLVIEPKRLAKYAVKTVRASGEVLPGGRVLQPEKLWVKTEASWQSIND